MRLLATAFCLFIPQLTFATIWYVDGGVSESGDGASWAAALKTIHEAVNGANDFDEIWVKEGTYLLSSPIYILNSIHLYGGFSGNEILREQRNSDIHVTKIDGNNAVQCINISKTSDQIIIDGFLITRGFAVSGGGIYNTNPYVIVNKCVFIDNQAFHSGGGNTWGGAIINYGARVTDDVSVPAITNCIFWKNKSISNAGGAGIANLYSNPFISGCIFYDNNRHAVINYYAHTTITQSILWNNIYSEVATVQTGDTFDITYSVIKNGYPGEGNITLDPMFLDPDNGDFRLAEGSPAQDIQAFVHELYMANTHQNGDIDGDGDIDSTDAMMLEQYLVGLRNSLPILYYVADPTPTPEASPTPTPTP